MCTAYYKWQQPYIDRSGVFIRPLKTPTIVYIVLTGRTKMFEATNVSIHQKSCQRSAIKMAEAIQEKHTNTETMSSAL